MATAVITKTSTATRNSMVAKRNTKPRIGKGRRLGVDNRQSQVSRAAGSTTGFKTAKSANVRRTTLRSASDPSSSNNSKWTSSDVSGRSCSNNSREEQQRRSNTPSPESPTPPALATTAIPAPLTQRMLPALYKDDGGRHGDIPRPRKKPRSLNLSFIPKAAVDAVAYREGSSSPQTKKRQLENKSFVNAFASTRPSRRSEMPRKIVQRPSPKSLREARIRRLSKQNAKQNSPEKKPLQKPHRARRFASYVSTPERSRANSRFSFRSSMSHVGKRNSRANVEVRLANLSVPEITRHASDGYVVDIVSSFIVRELPMSRSTRALAMQYIRWGQSQITMGISNIVQQSVADSGSPWQQWAYISRLNMADIGRDGRRRTLAHIDEVVKEESWVVLLVPLREGQADDLRGELLACQTGDKGASRRRRNLESEIASSIEENMTTNIL